jgi:hypothetical protein
MTSITAFIISNICLWGAFAALSYNYVILALKGALIPTWLYSLIGLIFVVSVVFSYLTNIIIEKA